MALSYLLVEVSQCGSVSLMSAFQIFVMVCRIGHIDKDCIVREQESEVKNMVDHPYGVWLRAGSFNERNNQGRFQASIAGKMGHPSGVRGGPSTSQPKVDSM